MTTIAIPTAGAAAAAVGRGLSAWRALAAAGIATSVVTVAGFGVWAALTASATNVTPHAVSTGTLKLELSANGVGFTQSVANLAPGDSVHRYVSLANTGTIEAGPMSLGVTATGANALLADAGTAKALRLSVDSCSVAWNAVTGACSGTVTTQLGATAVGSLATAAPLAAIANTSPGTTHHLRLRIQLPDQTENVVNGVLPGGSVQSATADLTYTFTHAQRTASTTSS